MRKKQCSRTAGGCSEDFRDMAKETTVNCDVECVRADLVAVVVVLACFLVVGLCVLYR